MDEVIDGDEVTAVLELSAGRHHFTVRFDGLEQLDDRRLLRQRAPVTGHEQITREVDERLLRSDERRESERQPGVLDHVGRGPIEIVLGTVVVEALPEEQLVGEDALLPIEDRLPCYKHRVAGLVAHIFPLHHSVAHIHIPWRDLWCSWGTL